jgi:hypothetical protein
MKLRNCVISLQGTRCTENVPDLEAVVGLNLVRVCETDLASIGRKGGKMARI